MRRKYKPGVASFTFAGVEGKAETVADDVIVYWCGRKQYYATLSPVVRAAVIKAVFSAGLLVA